MERSSAALTQTRSALFRIAKVAIVCSALGLAAACTGALIPSAEAQSSKVEIGEEWLYTSSVERLVLPEPRGERGEGPYETLIIQNVNIIDGTGAPLYGPMTVTVSGNEIAGIDAFDASDVTPVFHPAEARVRG